MDIFDIVRKRVIKSQYRMIEGWGVARVVLRFDDNCGNGHNTFSITMESKSHGGRSFGGCMHDEIAIAFPEYTTLISWHLMSSDGPMHYIANTIYHMECHNLRYARSSAIAPNASKEQLLDEQWLKDRLPGLIDEFKMAMTKTFS